MVYNPEKHHRRSLRLPEYDYAGAGSYFVTFCTHHRIRLFGGVVDGQMRLNDAGRIAELCWLDIPRHFPDVELDAFVIMPNHIHGIIRITGPMAVGMVGLKNFSAPPGNERKFQSPSRTIGSIIRGFKIGVTKWFREHTEVFTVWQSNYHEHIIRNDDALNRIRRYIINNPKRWASDKENQDPEISS